VVEACNRLKGGKLPKEKLKMQLQKIANSRTGGSKTDEALGKTGGGPEGLPHSIIVTEEGVEGEVVAATRVEPALETAGPAESDLLGDAQPGRGSVKAVRDAARRREATPAAKARRKSDQMALFDKAADAKHGGKRARAHSKSPGRRK
jgi:DNA topoisomerase-6 subunit B